MASHSLLVLALVSSCLLLSVHAQKDAAPAPKAAGPINLTGILDKAGQYTTFMRLLTSTQVSNQIYNQLNSSDQGMTVFAPTDNAFNNLKPGTLNSLSTQDQVELVLYHVLPKYYSLVMFETASNPVRTQSSDGLNFTTSANQVNVSTGMVDVILNNALRQEFPLSVYQVDKVLLPLSLFGAKPPVSPPPPPSPTDAKKPKSSTSGPAAADGDKPSSAVKNMGMGLVAGIAAMFIGFL
ncbi:hypothetical protein MKW92_015492 [Papaver armeniacum]|nr:hypothetical protein MKW92_003287 [Papaver armeniacum]KAI3955092.1 hypothetical protein MKW92_015492 [Papaver armeniacum]